MVFDETLRDLMPDTIDIAPMASRDKFGDLTYGPSVTYQCRVMYSDERVVTLNSSQYLSRAVIWCAPHPVSGIPTLTPDCLLTLSNGEHPTLLRLDIIEDDGGPHHFKLTCNRPFRM